ncbi:MAG: hypothetical protein ABJB86_13920 [Bacteroidota bacterium]
MQHFGSLNYLTFNYAFNIILQLESLQYKKPIGIAPVSAINSPSNMPMHI